MCMYNFFLLHILKLMDFVVISLYQISNIVHRPESVVHKKLQL